MLERGSEGLMAKDPESPYLGGHTLEVAEGEAARLSCRGAGLDTREQIIAPWRYPEGVVPAGGQRRSLSRGDRR